MSPTIDWREIALRLALTALAGALIGLDRGGHVQSAGLRTTLLVCFAASVAMIQANLLLAVRGHTDDSFVSIDVMRLPLGILSGMGFIGAGAILRRSGSVLGVTTAATLWFSTVIGLCFGGGQLALGLASLTVCLMVLGLLKRAERLLTIEHEAKLVIDARDGGPSDATIKQRLLGCGYKIRSWSVCIAEGGARRTVTCHLRWRARDEFPEPPSLVDELARDPHVLEVRWES